MLDFKPGDKKWLYSAVVDP